MAEAGRGTLGKDALGVVRGAGVASHCKGMSQGVKRNSQSPLCLYSSLPVPFASLHSKSPRPQTVHEIKKILVSTLKINIFSFKERETNPNPKGKQQVCYLGV